MNEVDESIADIGMISEVNGEVKEVVPAGVVLVDLLQQRRLVVLVGDVLNHHAQPADAEPVVRAGRAER